MSAPQIGPVPLPTGTPPPNPPAPLRPTLGSLPFDLSAEALRAESDRLLREAETALSAIEAAPEAATAETLLTALDRAITPVADLGNHGGLLFVAHPDPARREAGRAAREATDRFFNAFRLRVRLYDRLRSADTRSLDPAGGFAREKLLREMRRAGVELPAAERERVRTLSDAIDADCQLFTDQILRFTRTVRLPGTAALEGLPDDYRRAHPPGPDGAVTLTTQYPDVMPVLAYARRAETRTQVLQAFHNRAYPENVPVLKRILEGRYALARALGYPTYAAYVMEDKMMGDPARARAFLDRLSQKLRSRADADLTEWLARKRADDPAAERLELWDAGSWSAEGYYDTKVRLERYGVDAKELREDLPYAGVRDGLLALCEELFRIEIRPVAEADRWHPAVEVFDVYRAGVPFGRFYLDMAPREGRYSHAAQFDVRMGLAGVQLPQAALLCNFVDPKLPPAEARMEYAHVVTFFHEFGHLLHALFSGHGRWMYNGMGFLEWDFIEAPSQLFEEWARDPKVLARFARQPGTGRPLPAELLARLRAADRVGRANMWRYQTMGAAIALAYYDRDPAGIDPTAVFRAIMAEHTPVPPPEWSHMEAAWGHLTGYSALYYTYAWSLVIARDLLSAFAARGTLTDPELALRYAERFLAPGSERPAERLIEEFLGRPFEFGPFERWALARPDDP